LAAAAPQNVLKQHRAFAAAGDIMLLLLLLLLMMTMMMTMMMVPVAFLARYPKVEQRECRPCGGCQRRIVVVAAQRFNGL
jgi:hypothetical protein